MLSEDRKSELLRIIEDLKGTCEDLDVNELTTEECSFIDEYIFRCEICSWWYDLDEQVDEGLCEDCNEGG